MLPFAGGEDLISASKIYKNSTNELMNAVQGPSSRRGLRCTDIITDERPAPYSGPYIGKRILFERV